jgi:simple sugar transport system permease protein
MSDGLTARLSLIADAVAPPLVALVASAVLFAAFLAVAGADPFAAFEMIYIGAFGTWFSWQNTLQKASPLLLTGLAMALPARVGLMVIGGEGALVIGGLACAVIGPAFAGLAASAAGTLAAQALMLAGGMAVGALWLMIPGALRFWRGVNETISSLLLNTIAIAVMNQLVEGPLRDPASLNKPSTVPLPPALMLGQIPGLSVHVGLGFGLIFAVAAGVLMQWTSFGFAARINGGNPRAARLVGIDVGRLILIACAFAGACAGLAGAIEVAAVQGSATASLAAGYGYSGILVAFLARHNPFAIIPVAVLLGGIAASDGLLQRHLDLPDATVTVLQGFVFIAVLAAETFSGRLRFWSGGQRDG